jgi:hypothetical protein
LAGALLISRNRSSFCVLSPEAWGSAMVVSTHGSETCSLAGRPRFRAGHDLRLSFHRLAHGCDRSRRKAGPGANPATEFAHNYHNRLGQDGASAPCAGAARRGGRPYCPDGGTVCAAVHCILRPYISAGSEEFRLSLGLVARQKG